MLDLCYYNSQVKEELDGACDYITKAMQLKSSHPDWAKMYADMSEQELNHASNLVKIFEDDYKKSKTEDPIYESVHNTLLDMYLEFTAKVKAMQQTFNK